MVLFTGQHCLLRAALVHWALKGGRVDFQLNCLLGGRLIQTMVNFLLAHLNNTRLDHFQDAVDAGR